MLPLRRRHSWKRTTRQVRWAEDLWTMEQEERCLTSKCLPVCGSLFPLCSRSRTETGRQPREDANTAAGVFVLRTLAKPLPRLEYYEMFWDSFPNCKPRLHIQSRLNIDSCLFRFRLHLLRGKTIGYTVFFGQASQTKISQMSCV